MREYFLNLGPESPLTCVFLPNEPRSCETCYKSELYLYKSGSKVAILYFEFFFLIVFCLLNKKKINKCRISKVLQLIKSY